MKLLNLLYTAPLAAALVVPDQEVFNQITTEAREKSTKFQKGAEWLKHGLEDDVKKTIHAIKSKAGAAKHSIQTSLDDALEFSHGVGQSLADEVFDARSWLETTTEHVYDLEQNLNRPPPDGPHDKPPHRGPHHGPHKKPHHKPNETVYELIAKSKYTTKLAKLINKFPDLVEALNTTANITVFAPTDRAFAKIPENAPEPSKEQLKKLLSYHVSPEFFPAGRVLVTHTIPTLLDGEELSEEPKPQRLSVNIGLRGLTLNFYSRVVAIDILGTNGVIHGIDSLLLPPPRSLKIIDLLPGEFSTLELGLTKTGLLEELADESYKGGTLFAPSNFAFQKLGPRINAFLFSKYGLKYLKGLLKYHLVPEITLYSDAVYIPSKEEKSVVDPVKNKALPKGYFHFDLPTLLEDRTLSVDVLRYGGFISIKINGFARTTVQDGIARDGVIHVVGNVLVPPKKVDGVVVQETDDGGEICLEEFKRRLAPYVE